jgi:oxygen-independent coproporphyrinogen III oxidase
LQLKKGYLNARYFAKKFGVDIIDEWRAVWDEYVAEGYAVLEDDRVELTRAGLLRVDGLLPAFFESEFRDVRYT